MSRIAETTNQQLDETSSLDNPEPDLIQELGQRLGCLWGYDRFIDNATGRPDLQEYWRDVKSQEQMRIEQLKRLIEQRILSNRF